MRLRFYAIAFAVWFFILFVMTSGLVDPDWLWHWQRWDAIWYFRIWREGYLSDPMMAVYPPGYSWLVGILSSFISSRHAFNLAALLLNMVSLFIGGVMLTEFCSRRFHLSYRRFFIFFLSLPPAFYAFSVYSDALFLLIFWGALILAAYEPGQMTRAEKIFAAVYMFFVPWVRLTGYALAIWVLFRRWFSASVLITFSILLAVNYKMFGDALHFLHMQQKFTMPEGGFFSGFYEATYTLFNNGNPLELSEKNFHFWLQVAFLPMVSLFVLLGVAIYFTMTGEYLIALTVATVVIFSRNQAFWRSAFRYDWPLLVLIAVPLLAPTKNGAIARWICRRASLQNNSSALATDEVLARRLRRIQKSGKHLIYLFMVMIFAFMQIHLAIRLHRGYWSF